MSVADRLSRLRQKLAERGLDYLLVTQPDNRRYLSGFPDRDVTMESSAGWLLVGRDESFFLTSFLYFEAAQKLVKSMTVVKSPPSRLMDGMLDLLGKLPPGKLGFEGNWLSYEQYAGLSSGLQGRHELQPAAGLVEELRIVKDADEIAALAAAVELTDRAFEHVAGIIRPGMTEKQVAWEIDKYMREHGAEGVAFETAVAAGPNTAVPHHLVSDRPIAEGEPVWIDMGARLNGYCGDLTRSFCLGRADAKFQEVYDVVLRAQLAAEDALRPGLTGVEGDALARDVIAAAGYGETFQHSLGHGIGLAIHEAPRVSPRGTETLAAGMVTSVEPGIYLPGWGGVRIEDVVVYESSGVRVLTRAPKQVIIS